MCPGGKQNVPQSSPLAIIPYGAISCTLDQFETEAAATGVPDRLSYSVIGQTELGRDIFGVVVNALDTPEQQAAFDRWEQLRAIMLTDPEAAQDLLAHGAQTARTSSCRSSSRPTSTGASVKAPTR